jgi:hypothetical protein
MSLYIYFSLKAPIVQEVVSPTSLNIRNKNHLLDRLANKKTQIIYDITLYIMIRMTSFIYRVIFTSATKNHPVSFTSSGKFESSWRHRIGCRWTGRADRSEAIPGEDEYKNDWPEIHNSDPKSEKKKHRLIWCG